MDRWTRKAVPVLLALISGPTLGCAMQTGSPSPAAGERRLEVVGPTRVELGELERHQVEVRYLERGGERIRGAEVSFGLEGRSGGATLSAAASRTSDVGIASVELEAGRDASFRLVATAHDAAPAVIEVSVRRREVGELDYVATYAGDRRIEELNAALFSNTSCRHIDDRVPAPRDVRRPVLDRTDTFEDVQVGVSQAIYVLGLSSTDHVIAEGCEDVRLDEERGEVDVVLEDVGVGTGHFEVEEVYDVRDGNLVLSILHFVLGLASDPAHFLVEFAAENDLLGGVASWGVTRSIVAAILDDLIGDIVPVEYRQALDSMYEDFDSALGNMTFHGELEWGRRAPDEIEREGVHRIRRVVMPMLNDRDFEYRVDEEAEMWVSTHGNELTLWEHEVSVPVGRYVADLLEQQLLPRLPGSPRSADDVLDEVFDCREMVDRLGIDRSTAEDIAVRICEIGVGLLADQIDGWLRDLAERGRLHIEGTAFFEGSLDTVDYREIEDAEMDAWWVSDHEGELLSFTGEMTGRRIDDGRSNHPVLDRVRDFFL